MTANALLSRWYQSQLGTAIVAVFAATGFGVLIMAPVAQLLIDAYGWRDAYRVIGAVLLALALLTAFLPLSRMSRGSGEWQRKRAVSDAATALRPVR